MAKSLKTNNNILIPEGWQYIPFEEVFEFVQSVAFSREQLTLEKTKDVIYNIHYGDIHATYKSEILDFETEMRIPKIKTVSPNQRELPLLKEGDLIIADASEDYDGVAACIEVVNLNGKKCTGGLHTFVARDFSNLTVAGFRPYIFKHPVVSNELKKLATGSKVYGVSKTNLASLYLLIPSKKDQKKIVQILSAYNRAIEKQSSLILEKEKLMNNLTMKLLSGKKRFKEFQKRSWNEVSLSEAAWYQEGPGLRQWQFKREGIKVINITNIVDGIMNLSRTDRHISWDEFNKTYKHFEVQANDIVVASSGNSYCKHGVVRACDLPLVMNTSVIRFKPLDNCDYDFLNQFLKSPFLKAQIDVLITGGAQPNFGPAHLAEVTIPFPKIDEQKKISKTLLNCDMEIANLKKQLHNMIQQKKGVMQQLLTGKIKLKK